MAQKEGACIQLEEKDGLRFVIPGPPVGKGRPKLGNRRAYTPQKTRDYEGLVKHAFASQCFVAPYGKGVPVCVIIFAYYPVPRSVTKKVAAQMLANKTRPTKKPDFDNIGKIVCDALNGLAWLDDAQVVDGRVIKLYDEAPRVEVCIRAIKEGET